MIPHLFWFWEQLTRGWGCWVIFDRRSNESLGYLRQDDDRQLSIAIAPRRQQFGYGTRVLTWAARHLDAWARVERSNAPSRKAFERSGWILAGLVGPYVLYKTRFHGTIEGQPGMATDDPSKRHL